MNNKIKLTRTVTKKECPWLSHELPAGTEIERYTGATYGCISDSGFAAIAPGHPGFVELPNDCI